MANTLKVGDSVFYRQFGQSKSAVHRILYIWEKQGVALTSNRDIIRLNDVEVLPAPPELIQLLNELEAA
jgi:hypothetical protein